MPSDPDSIIDRVRDTFQPYTDAEDDPVLDQKDIEALDTVAEAQERYEAEGLDLSWNDAYGQLQEDWWHAHRDHTVEQGTGLPGEGRTVTIDNGEETYTADITVHGVVHGFPDYLPMSDELEEYLLEETRGFLDDGDAVYVEEGFEEIFYNDWDEEYDGFHEMGDVEWLTEESGMLELGAFGVLFEGVMKPLSRYQGRLAEALSDLPEEYRSPGIDKMVTQIEALKDREALAEAHPVERAGRLPAPLRDDGLLRVSAPADEKTSYDGLAGEVEERGREFMHRLIVGRSQAMAEEALEAVREGETDHVRLVVGLGHQYDILEYLDDLDGSQQ